MRGKYGVTYSTYLSKATQSNNTASRGEDPVNRRRDQGELRHFVLPLEGDRETLLERERETVSREREREGGGDCKQERSCNLFVMQRETRGSCRRVMRGRQVTEDVETVARRP